MRNGNGEIRAAQAATNNKTKKGNIGWMAVSSAVLCVEEDHEIAVEVADIFPDAIPEILEIAPEKALEIAKSNPGEVLDIVNYLAKIRKIDIIMDIIESFPKYAARIVAFTEKYGVNPVTAFSRVKDGGSRIEIARKNPKFMDEFVKVCPEFKKTALLLS